MFIFYFLGVGVLAVRFSVSSGCVRRHSVSTYAAILVLLYLYILQVSSKVTLVEETFLGTLV